MATEKNNLLVQVVQSDGVVLNSAPLVPHTYDSGSKGFMGKLSSFTLPGGTSIGAVTLSMVIPGTRPADGDARAAAAKASKAQATEEVRAALKHLKDVKAKAAARAAK